jgi:hypothetical protein
MNKIPQVTELDYSEIEEWIDTQYDIPHFEENIFKRLAVGWSVINDYLPEIKMDSGLDALLRDEVNARDVIRDNPEHEAVKQILLSSGEVSQVHLMKFLEKNYQLHKVQVRHLIKELKNQEKIAMNGDNFTLPRHILEELKPPEEGQENVMEQETGNS